jgi:hypothetical protein
LRWRKPDDKPRRYWQCPVVVSPGPTEDDPYGWRWFVPGVGFIALHIARTRYKVSYNDDLEPGGRR